MTNDLFEVVCKLRGRIRGIKYTENGQQKHLGGDMFKTMLNQVRNEL